MSDLLESYAAALRESGNYRVLKRLEIKEQYFEDDFAETRIAIALDTETTGTNCVTDEIIQLSMTAFTYDNSGRIHKILDSLDQFRQPLRNYISPEITNLTGITPEMVAGKSIDAKQVEEYIQRASVITSHQCLFDRPFCESLLPVFKSKHWACSLTQINWMQEGHQSARLGDLLADLGYYHFGHNAAQDVAALIAVLQQTLPSGSTAFAEMLENARRTTALVEVRNARKHTDFLRSHGYRWAPEAKCWWREAGWDRREAEMALVREECPGTAVSASKVTARTRFRLI